MEHDSPLWLDDGNVVLTAAGSAFKVHRGILERHSPAFKDLFSPLPVDGSPVVSMHDEPTDLAYFLLALYDGLHFDQRRASNFPIIRGVLRLSIKYHVEYLRLEALKMLQHDWPTTLVAWDLREREASGSGGAYESSKIRPHPIFVIQLARELGPPGASLLPAAFYDLSRYNCSHIWTGLLVQSPERSTNTLSTRLMPADLQTVMGGKEASQSFIAQFLRRELLGRNVASLCDHRPYGRECRMAFDVLAHELYRGIVGVTCGRDSDPLFTLNAAVGMQARDADGSVGVNSASRACEQCRVVFAQVASVARHYVWNQLPSWFGLEAVLACAEGSQ